MFSVMLLSLAEPDPELGFLSVVSEFSRLGSYDSAGTRNADSGVDMIVAVAGWYVCGL